MIPILFICHNRLDFTKQALSRLLEAKSTERFSVYVYDSGSTDDTRAWLTGAFALCQGSFNVVYLPTNEGPIKCFNRFLDATSDYKYVAKVDNDMLVPDHWLDNLLSVAESASLYIIGAKHQTYKESFDHYAKRVALKVRLYHGSHLYYVNMVQGSGILLRRDIVASDRLNESFFLNSWSYYQNAFSRRFPMHVAFYDGVVVSQLDIDWSGNKVSTYVDYDRAVEEIRLQERKERSA